MKNNFCHIIWEEEKFEAINKIYEKIKSFLKNKGFKEKFSKKCVRTFYKNVEGNNKKIEAPFYEIGISKDNIIITKLEGQFEELSYYNLERGLNFIANNSPSIEELLDIVKEEINNNNPFITICGINECIINCRNCCDSNPLESFRRRYCEYFIGNSYCALQLSGLKKDEVCNNYFCSSFRDDPIDCYSGPFGIRPRIARTYNLDKETKRIIKAILENKPKNEEELKELLKDHRRYQEVVLYKSCQEIENKQLKEKFFKEWLELYEKRKKKEKLCSLEERICNFTHF
jgi:hypothetical protein